MTPNERAFLDTIAFSEIGKKLLSMSDNGYNVIVGGGLFTSYADHPRKLVRLPKLGVSSTAAGRYQLLSKYYDHYKALLGLRDFSPASQDAIALQQIREFRALVLINAGKFDDAVHKLRTIWASFPGAGYGQHEQKLHILRDEFIRCGGVIK